MNKQELEQKLGVTILEAPTTYDTTDETKVNVKLSCDHTKLVSIKSLIKKTPKCTICNPPKPREKKTIDLDHVGTIILEEVQKEIVNRNDAFLTLLLQRLVEDDVEKTAKIFSMVKRELAVRKQ